MAGGIPDALTAQVRFYGPPWLQDGQRDKLYLFAAHKVIEHFIQRNFFAELPRADTVFLDGRSVNVRGDIFYGFPARILLIGESLFLLRQCRGFNEICRRLKSQTLRAAYFEMIAAKQFFRAGFDIQAKPESGIRGEDFDFTALRRAVKINVEVTALDDRKFSAVTVLNALNQKRKQLPRTHPTVIFCVLPERWRSEGINLNIWAATTAKTFLRQTRRVNAIVFAMEHHFDIAADQTRGMLVLILKPFFNNDVYFPCDLSFLEFEHSFSPHLRAAIAGEPIGLNDLTRKVRRSEFYEWVDALVP